LKREARPLSGIILRVETAIEAGDKVEQARSDERQRENPDQRFTLRPAAQGGQDAADLMRLMRIAIRGRGDEVADDQRDRGAAPDTGRL
jgi:hypothetical protein